MSLDSYFQIIHDKTASLIAASCEMGAMLGGGDEGAVRLLKRFGNSVGTAFQIRDDLLDLLSTCGELGKPAGRDLEKGKLTLPIITMLSENPSLKSAVLSAITNNDRTTLRGLLESSGSINVALGEVNRLVDGAVATIKSALTSESSNQLCKLATQLKRGF